MKRTIKWILLVLLVSLLLVQIPFIYRRYQYGKLADKVAQLNSQRVAPPDDDFREYKGIIHAHTSLGGHSTGSFEELIKAANDADLDFVIMTEHYSDLYDTSALTLNGYYGRTLFIGGNEVDTADGDRFLLIPGSPEAAGYRNLSTNDFLNKVHAENRLALITYPEKFRSWDSNFDGIEAFSLHTQAKKMNPFTAFFDLIWSYPAYPELTLANYFTRPDANLAKFDEASAKRNIMMSAGTDAHSNIGFHIFGDDAGNHLINIKIDPYVTMFRVVRVHINAIPSDQLLTQDAVLAALRSGQTYIGFDSFGDTSGFRFMRALNSKYLAAESPLPARFVFFRNGEKVFQESNKTKSEVIADSPGAYRVEVYRDDLGPPFDKMPWIISNPIYVR